MTVVAYDPYVARGSEIAVAVDRVESLKGLLAASDVVSLHCPLTDETREMINAATIAQMKRDTILINTARGAIVDIRALLDALHNGEIAGAGIDVLPIEPPKRDDVVAMACVDQPFLIIGDLNTGNQTLDRTAGGVPLFCAKRFDELSAGAGLIDLSPPILMPLLRLELWVDPKAIPE